MSGPPSNSDADEFHRRLEEQLARARALAPDAPTDSGESPAESPGGPHTGPGPEQRQAESGSADSSGPVGAGDHVVLQGECISSIAKDEGFFWETVWNDAGNEELREVRQNPNVLLPEDRVAIPAKRRKDEPIAPEMRHRFRRRGEPGWLRMRLLDEGEPRTNLRYILEIEGEQPREGRTDADGRFSEPIPSNARRGKLILIEELEEESVDEDEFDENEFDEHSDEAEAEYPGDEGDNDDEAEEWREEILLQFGALDPIRDLTGVAGRLKNLGLLTDTPEGVSEDEIRTAVREFQKFAGLQQTGIADEQTRQRLEREHGT